MPRKTKAPGATLVRPSAKGLLLNRQCCSGCSKHRPVAVVDGQQIIADHLVFVRDDTHSAGGTH
jgi:hypothetical protein